MHDLKFIEATKRLLKMEGVALSSPACQKALAVFTENLRLASGLVASPGWAAMIKMQWDVASNNAAVDISGPEGLLKMNTWTPEEVKKWQIDRLRLMAESVQEMHPLQHHHLEVITRELDELAYRCGDFVHGMMEGLLKSMCIQGWSAIETLIEDLHGKVIQEHPKCFSTEIQERNHRTLNYIKPGKRFYFRKRDDFRDAYGFAFGYDSAIDKAIGHDAIDSLTSIRNLIVHKNSVVDAQFMKDEEPKAPSLKKHWTLHAGAELKFNGEIAHALVDAAAEQAYCLIRAVNSWLEAKFLQGLK